jgi:type I pantothenate kinase
VAAGFESFTREQWAARADTGGGSWPTGTAESVALGEPLAPEEVGSVYVPLCRLVTAVGEARREQVERTGPFRSTGRAPGPLMIGIAGGVAVGKSTVARVVQALLGRDGQVRVDLVSTDAFLLPNRVLEARGLVARKGFPETYDRGALIASLAAIRSGETPVAVPVYSHHAYDIVEGEHQSIEAPDIVVVEGLTVLQTDVAGTADPRVVTDFLDLAVYLDADEEDAAAWHSDRLMGLWASGGDGPFLGWLSSLSEEQARQVARASWSEINLVNLRQHVAPTARRAHVVLRKDRRHRVHEVLVRLP